MTHFNSMISKEKRRELFKKGDEVSIYNLNGTEIVIDPMGNVSKIVDIKKQRNKVLITTQKDLNKIVDFNHFEDVYRDITDILMSNNKYNIPSNYLPDE